MNRRDDEVPVAPEAAQSWDIGPIVRELRAQRERWRTARQRNERTDGLRDTIAIVRDVGIEEGRHAWSVAAPARCPAPPVQCMARPLHTPQIKRERMLVIDLRGCHHHAARRVAHSQEARQAS